MVKLRLPNVREHIPEPVVLILGFFNDHVLLISKQNPSMTSDSREELDQM